MDTHQEPLEQDPRGDVWTAWPGAVLLDDEIRYYCTMVTPKLIDPFDSKYLKPARYQLTLGPEAQLGGKTTPIDETHPLVIPAHQVAIVRTYESLNIPRFLIGRWNLRVDMVYKGLLWVGALQVDPGWTGYLPCPLYNLSDAEVRIGFREKVFTIDFVRTTRFNPQVNKPYPGPPKRLYNPPLAFFDSLHLRSGPYEALQDLEEIELGWAEMKVREKEASEEMRGLRSWGVAAVAVLFAVVAAVTGAVSIVAIRPVVDVGPNSSFLSFWPMTALVFAWGSTALSICSLVFVWKMSKVRKGKSATSTAKD